MSSLRPPTANGEASDVPTSQISGNYSYADTWDPRNAKILRKTSVRDFDDSKTRLEDIFDDHDAMLSVRSDGDAPRYLDLKSAPQPKNSEHSTLDSEQSNLIDILSTPVHVEKKKGMFDPANPHFKGNASLLALCLSLILVFCLWHIPEEKEGRFMSYLPKYDSYLYGEPVSFGANFTARLEVEGGKHHSRDMLQIKMILQEHITGRVQWALFEEVGGVPEKLESHSVELEKNGDEPTQYLEDFDIRGKLKEDSHAYIEFSSTSTVPVSGFVQIIQMGSIGRYRVMISGLLLAFVYVFIGLEIIHRTLVALIGAFVSLSLLTAISHTPSMGRVITFMDEGTLSLLFGMMIIVETLSKTGVFEWIAVRMVVKSCSRNEDDLEGVEWCNLFKLTVFMCLFSGIVSAFLDNVTTLLLLSPVTIQLCGMIKPKNSHKLAIPLLIVNAVFGNVGGTMTLIGAIPNVIIGERLSEYIGFLDFIINLMPCIILMTPLIIAYIRWQHKEVLVGKYQVNLEELRKTYCIKEEVLLTRAGMIATTVVFLLFLHPFHHQQSGWVALTGAMIILLIGSNEDLHHTIQHVEWDTLLFFAGLFVMIASMAELGLIRWIGDQIVSVIEAAPKDQQLLVSILIILWVSSISSGFLSNIAFAATMVPVIKIIGEDEELDLPMAPLAWALSFGTCLGGNLTLVGSAASLVAMSAAESAGMKMSFYEFGKTGVPVWLITTTGSTIYMIVVYVWILG